MAERGLLRATAVAASGQLGGTERVLLDFATRAFEHDIAVRVLTPRDGPLVGILNEVGVPTEVVPASRALLSGSQQLGRLWSVPAALPGLLRWSRALAGHRFLRNADVVYTVAYKAHLAAAFRRLHPVVWHLHEFPPATIGGLWRRLGRRVPDARIANSEAVGAAWAAGEEAGVVPVGVAGGRASPRIAVVRNGVDLDRFRPRRRTWWIHDRLGIPRKHRLVGMPAVFARWKGHPEVIAAFERVRREVGGLHLVIVGGSIYDTVAERSYRDALARRIAAAEAVRLLPFQPKIERAYPEFDVVVHYSLRPEPFGRVIVEAMACGVPVIAAGEGGPLEILGGGIGPRREAGWLAEPRSPEALARLLRSALGLPTDVLRGIGHAGRRRAEDHFSARVFAKRIAEVLRQAHIMGLGPRRRWGTGHPRA